MPFGWCPSTLGLVRTASRHVWPSPRANIFRASHIYNYEAVNFETLNASGAGWYSFQLERLEFFFFKFYLGLEDCNRRVFSGSPI